jgi:sugar (pentulose or hexulose) kinase
MPNSLQFVPPKSIITGWDFSTGGVKCLAFDLHGKTVATIRLPTDLWKGDPSQEDLSELNLMQLEGQARASVRAMARLLRDKGRLEDWIAGGISATHHTAGRLDADHNQVRRAICWNDHTLARYHAIGLKRLGGQERAAKLIGGPWAIRYSLSHLVKDEDASYFPPEAWKQTARILPHGPLAAGYLTGNFDVISVSSAASTGMMDLVRRRWAWGMLDALEQSAHRTLVRKQLPEIVLPDEPIGPLSANLALEAGMNPDHLPLVFPTSDDQAAGLVGGGAVDAGDMAVILGNSAVVNSSSDERPRGGNLDVMRLNWGPYLWMRCYHNGAQFLDKVVGEKPDWQRLESAAGKVPPGCDGVWVMPFLHPEPSLQVSKPRLTWSPKATEQIGVRFRASLEALAYLIALGVREHEKAGQRINRIFVSGGIARSELMCRILASVLGRRLELLQSDEGPALGAAVTALAAYESHRRQQSGVQEPYTVADAVNVLVKYRKPVEPQLQWQGTYAKGLGRFEDRLRKLAGL